MSRVNQLYEHLRALQWPKLARGIGDFALYESLLAGVASRAVNGETVDVSELPELDATSREQIEQILQKGMRSPEEEQFLEYFKATENLRQELACRK